MRTERWVWPSAALVAAGTVLAVAPPGGELARGLRVELAEGATPSVLLLRCAVEQAGAVGWWAPARARVFARGRGVGAGDVRAGALEASPRDTWAFGFVERPTTEPVDVRVEAEGFEARFEVPALGSSRIDAGGSTAAQPGAATLGPRPAAPELRVVGGVLVPEVPAVLLVRLPEGVSTLRLEATDGALALAAPQVEADRCGLAAVRATVRGFDAHVVLRDSEGRERGRRRLPVAPGAVALAEGEEPAGAASARDEPAIYVRGAVAGQLAFVLFGNESGLLRWGSTRLRGDEQPEARLAWPAEARWALASAVASGPWSAGLARPGVVAAARGDGACEGALAAAWLRSNLAPRGRALATATAFDGASAALRARLARQARVRRWALGAVASGLFALAALVGAGALRRDEAPLAVAGLAARRRERLLQAAASIALFALAGALLLATQWVRG